MTFPEKKSETDNSNKAVSFNFNIPVVHSISSNALFSQGWILFGRETKGQSIIAIYKKGDNEIRYNGTHWTQNGQQIQFMEDIK